MYDMKKPFEEWTATEKIEYTFNGMRSALIRQYTDGEFKNGAQCELGYRAEDLWITVLVNQGDKPTPVTGESVPKDLDRLCHSTL